MLVVGLTGGIASGKSTVARMLKDLGARVIDADALSREVMAPQTDCWKLVAKSFGEGIIGTRLTINRKKLASKIFADPEKRARLNSIVHPFIKKRIHEMLIHIGKSDPNAMVIIDAALLVETGMYRDYDRLVVVAAEEDVQLARLTTRDHLALQEARRRLFSQFPLAEKKMVADYVISNQGSLEETGKQAKAVYHALRILQSEKPGTEDASS